jgi:hypothetical protein
MLSVIFLSVIMLSVITLKVVALFIGQRITIIRTFEPDSYGQFSQGTLIEGKVSVHLISLLR